MIAISQLMQVLQTTEAAGPQPVGLAAASASGGLANFFSAILKQAREALGEHVAPSGSSAVVQMGTGTGVQAPEAGEGGETLAPTYEGLPVEHAASVLEALDKFEMLPIEHAVSVLEALRQHAETASSGEDPGAVKGEPETQVDVAEEAVINASITIDDAIDGLLAALTTVPLHPAPEAGALRAVPVPLPAPQPGEAVPKAASTPLQLNPDLPASQPGVSGQLASLAPPGILPEFGPLRAATVKPAAQGGEPEPAEGQSAQSIPRVTSNTVERPTLSEAFAKAVRGAQPQAQPKQGAETAVAQPPVLEALEVQLPAAKPQPLPAQTLAPPGTTEVAQDNHVAKSNVTTAQSLPERSPPEIVHVRDVGGFTVKSIRYLAGRNEETVTVRLVPRSLGELQISVRSTGQSLDLVMIVASHAARDAIEAQLSGLREMLARDGLDVAKVTVQTFTAGDQAPGHFASGHSAASGHAARTPTKFNGESFESEAGPRASPQGSAGHEGSLNMFV